jgi:tetrahydromethanopterin S-methyltransferase subunit B
MEQHPGMISAEEVHGTWTAHLYEFSVATVLLVLLAVLLTIAVLGLVVSRRRRR